ncbi:hypothetical protein [Streptomyces sp. NBC_01602]|uniref:hypothetical protein n=1 Tax=Streptomyces sp. NBC_01602 TaxID=2975893 RepID=UPI003866B3B6
MAPPTDDAPYDPVLIRVAERYPAIRAGAGRIPVDGLHLRRRACLCLRAARRTGARAGVRR